DPCTEVEGDSMRTCHVDCSLAGDAACPDDYRCSEVVVRGSVRSLCRPALGSCQEALGGFCDLVDAPQLCMRAGDAGTCVGARHCIPASDRYSTCDAEVPQCRATCETANPAGCALSPCASALA